MKTDRSRGAQVLGPDVSGGNPHEHGAQGWNRARVYAALGDLTRLAIVEAIQFDDASPGELARRLGVPSNLFLHHVRKLEDAGLVRRVVSEGDRRRSYLQFRPEAVEGVATLRPRSIAVPRIVFVCTRNSARSILAAALWSRASRVTVASAGTDPADDVHPEARRAAARIGLDLGDRRPSHVREVARPDDFIISTCDAARESVAMADCMPDTSLSGITPSLHWSVPDPVPLSTAEAFDRALTDLSWRIAHFAPNVASSPRVPSP